MSENDVPVVEPSGEREEGVGALLDPEVSDRLEAEDRKKPIPGGEPDCPRCQRKMTRRVERYPAPRGGSSPFRVSERDLRGMDRVRLVAETAVAVARLILA